MDIQYPEDIIGRGNQAIQQLRRSLFPIVGLLLLLIVGATSFYQIPADSVGVVTRFGAYVRQTEPGLHLKLPLFIERVATVPVRKIFPAEFGYRESQGRRRAGAAYYKEESIMLTGDLNVLDVQWIVQYRIGDPVQFLFNVHNPVELIRDMSEAVMRRVVGDHSVDESLKTQREEIGALVQMELQAILDNFKSGIVLEIVKLQDVTPPDQVKPAFNEVNEAEQERERTINQAWEAYNRVVPLALGEAEQKIREAEGYAQEVVNRAEGDASRFLSVWQEYRQAPEVTRRRLYLDALAEVLPDVKRKYIIDAEQKSLLPFMNVQPGGGN